MGDCPGHNGQGGIKPQPHPRQEEWCQAHHEPSRQPLSHGVLSGTPSSAMHGSTSASPSPQDPGAVWHRVGQASPADFPFLPCTNFPFPAAGSDLLHVPVLPCLTLLQCPPGQPQPQCCAGLRRWQDATLPCHGSPLSATQPRDNVGQWRCRLPAA